MHTDDGPTLIAFDGSPAARQAVETAAVLLKPRATLVLTVWEAALTQTIAAPAPDVGMPAIDPSAMLEMDEALRDHAERVANEGAELARSMGLDAEPLALADVRNIARTIVEVAREHNAATIVVGSRGLTGLRARFEGSTSKAVVQHAPCPVVVVHEVGEKQ
jgi:nucleotide-binding universal stress UspA family protein